MPTYIYRCDAGHETEKFEPMSASPVQICPACPQPPIESHENEDEPYCKCEPSLMRRLIGSGIGFTFKGGAPTPRFFTKR